jgi:ABC-type transport system involved in multi-copper enzyme maturation permease subunit
MRPALYSARTIGFIALVVILATVRQRVWPFVGLCACLVVIGAQFLRDFHFGSSELKFIADLGSGAIGGFGAVLTVTLTAQQFFAEMEQRTVLTVLAKPVRRGEFIVGKYVGIAVILGTFCGGLALLLAGVLWTRESSLLRSLTEDLAGQRFVNYGQLATGAVWLWLKLLVLAALTLGVASYSRTQLFTVTTGFLAYVICHLQHFAQAASAREGASISVVIVGWLARALPNFQLLGTDSGSAGGAVRWGQLSGGTAYAAGYVALALGIAVISFSRREL